MHALLLLLSAATLVQVPAPRAHEGDVARWERQARDVTIIRDDWGIPHVHGKTDADAVFGMIYAQAEDDFNRVETNYLNSIGPAGRGGGRGRDLAGPEDEAVHQPGQHASEVRREPGVAQATDERLGRRAQLLPPHPSRREAAGHHPLRAVDGAHVQRRAASAATSRASRSTSSRRSTATAPAGRRRPWEAAAATDRPSRRARTAFAIAPANTVEPPRALAHQPAHLVLLPLRAADDERRGAQRLRRGDVGPVLPLSGIQRAARLDAYARPAPTRWTNTPRPSSGKAGGCFYRYGGEERPVVAGRITVPYRTAGGHGDADVHGLPDAPRADRARGGAASGSASG